MLPTITVIHLQPHEAECYVCGADIFLNPEGGGFGIPIYEDEVLQDEDPGEWGGVPVCGSCYYLTNQELLAVSLAKPEAVYPRVRLADLRRLAAGQRA
jgi:hypothetical protein